MLKGLRRWLARKLCPEAFEAEEDLHWLKAELVCDRLWLKEMREIDAYLSRILAKLHNKRRKSGEPYIMTKWASDTVRFRDQLRRGVHLKLGQ